MTVIRSEDSLLRINSLILKFEEHFIKQSDFHALRVKKRLQRKQAKSGVSEEPSDRQNDSNSKSIHQIRRNSKTELIVNEITSDYLHFVATQTYHPPTHHHIRLYSPNTRSTPR